MTNGLNCKNLNDIRLIPGEKKLLNIEEFQNVTGLKGSVGGLLAKVLMKMLKFDELNEIYAKSYENDALTFIDKAFEFLEFNYHVDETDLERIPEKGPFIIVANHPIGGLEGLALIKLIHRKRPDFKLVANFLLQRIEPISDLVFPVNPFENHKEAKSSMKGLKQAILHLKEGNCLGIFPAGEVATYQSDIKKIMDRPWQKGALKLLKTAKTPIIPVWFQGNNSNLFHLLGMVHPAMRTAKLPSEQLNKKKQKLKVRIGKSISLKKQSEFKNYDSYGRYLRARTYVLGSPLSTRKELNINKFFKNKQHIRKVVAPLQPAINSERLQYEISKLPKETILFEQKSYLVLCSHAINIPLIMQEIGRLREKTFREVGEGTNRSQDIDEYDLYYHHLVIWDKREKKIVGAYRLGKGKEIISQYGKKGFYLTSLFKLKKGFDPYLPLSIELGRSFIVKEYQKKPHSLFLLWKGILYFLLQNTEYRYLIGPVSISNDYSKFSKSLLVDFIRSNFFNKEIAQWVKAKNKFQVDKNFESEREILLSSAQQNIKQLDDLIDENQHDLKSPVLLKKYLQLNAKIVGFNIDPKFNNCLDGLIMADIYDIPQDILKSLSKEIQCNKGLEIFHSRSNQM